MLTQNLRLLFTVKKSSGPKPWINFLEVPEAFPTSLIASSSSSLSLRSRFLCVFCVGNHSYLENGTRWIDAALWNSHHNGDSNEKIFLQRCGPTFCNISNMQFLHHNRKRGQNLLHFSRKPKGLVHLNKKKKPTQPPLKPLRKTPRPHLFLFIPRSGGSRF